MSRLVGNVATAEIMDCMKAAAVIIEVVRASDHPDSDAAFRWLNALGEGCYRELCARGAVTTEGVNH